VGGALGVIWVIVWAVVYRLPRQHPWLSAEELALIESDRPVADEEPPVPIRRLLGMKAVWGCIAARMLTDPISYSFIFWTPKFLQQERGFDLADIG
jgi:ACS family hexuronate transporter-like MFS transporter